MKSITMVWTESSVGLLGIYRKYFTNDDRRDSFVVVFNLVISFTNHDGILLNVCCHIA